MSILNLLYYPNEELRVKADVVDLEDPTLLELIQNLKDTCDWQRAHGVASTQTGTHKQVFVLKHPSKDQYKVVINPEILHRSEEKVRNVEGCLSFPGVEIPVPRSSRIVVSYHNEEKHHVEEALEGFDAVAFQHEFDHISGVLFLDHVSDFEKRFALKKLEKIRRRGKRIIKAMEKENKRKK